MRGTAMQARFGWALGLGLIGIVSCASPTPLDDTTAEGLLERSIRFHDPDGRWGRQPIELTWVGTGTEGEERLRFEIAIGADEKTFGMNGHYKGTQIQYDVVGDAVEVRIDGKGEFDDATRDRLVLAREDGLFWRNYFGFLAGLPMNLEGSGAQMVRESETTEFMGRPVDSLLVTFDPEIGTDVWTFYFEPETAQLLGCMFTKADPANPGEYLVFDGLVEAEGVRLPQRRRWYMNDDDRHLGDDAIAELRVSAPN